MAAAGAIRRRHLPDDGNSDGEATVTAMVTAKATKTTKVT